MTMSSMRFRNSGAKVSSSARRYSDCGAFCWVSDFEQVLYPTCVERIAAARDPTLEVRMITVFRKSTLRPEPSVRCPSSKICNRVLKTSGWAFSISSNRTTE